MDFNWCCVKARLNGLIEEFIRDSRYQINKDGTIIRVSDNKKLGYSKKTELKMRNKQYLYVKYQGKEIKIHRIVYRKFVGELIQKMVVHHEDGNGLNNSIANLSQVTPEINSVFKKSS